MMHTYIIHAYMYNTDGEAGKSEEPTLANGTQFAGFTEYNRRGCYSRESGDLPPGKIKL